METFLILADLNWKYLKIVAFFYSFYFVSPDEKEINCMCFASASLNENPVVIELIWKIQPHTLFKLKKIKRL